MLFSPREVLECSWEILGCYRGFSEKMLVFPGEIFCFPKEVLGFSREVPECSLENIFRF